MGFRVVPLSSGIPPGWRMATCSEFLANRDACLTLMSAWSICACADGKCDGSGYGGKATPGSSHDGIGDVLITNDGGAAPQRTRAGGESRQFKRMGYMVSAAE